MNWHDAWDDTYFSVTHDTMHAIISRLGAGQDAFVMRGMGMI